MFNKDNIEVTDMKQILQEQKQFYENLYTSKLKHTETDADISKSFFTDNNMPKLSNMDKDICENDVTIEECSKALQLLPNNKSPGSDGFTTNFYKFFWKNIKDMLFQSFQYSFEN